LLITLRKRYKRMCIKKLLGNIAIAVALNLSILGSANAVGLGASCFVSKSRSSISIVGTGMSGAYWAIVLSGDVAKGSKAKLANANGIVRFFFDSDPAAILRGATKIPVGYIKNAYVIVRIRRAGSNVLIGAVGPRCVVR
jgi:hypothetical protein